MEFVLFGFSKYFVLKLPDQGHHRKNQCGLPHSNADNPREYFVFRVLQVSFGCKFLAGCVIICLDDILHGFGLHLGLRLSKIQRF